MAEKINLDVIKKRHPFRHLRYTKQIEQIRRTIGTDILETEYGSTIVAKDAPRDQYGHLKPKILLISDDLEFFAVSYPLTIDTTEFLPKNSPARKAGRTKYDTFLIFVQTPDKTATMLFDEGVRVLQSLFDVDYVETFVLGELYNDPMTKPFTGLVALGPLEDLLTQFNARDYNDLYVMAKKEGIRIGHMKVGKKDYVTAKGIYGAACIPVNLDDIHIYSDLPKAIDLSLTKSCLQSGEYPETEDLTKECTLYNIPITWFDYRNVTYISLSEAVNRYVRELRKMLILKYPNTEAEL